MNEEINNVPAGVPEKKGIIGRIERSAHNGKKWFIERAHSTHAQAWLGGLSFAESSFFPIAPDLLLIAMLLTNAERWLRYATITTVTSVLGGLFGYFIGALFYDTIGKELIAFYGFEAEFGSLGKAFSDNVFWTIFTAAFTPIPYKIFTIAGGFFRVDIPIFIIASIVGRALRFYAVAFICYRYGPRISPFIEKYFNVFSLLFVALIFVGYALFALNISF